jgi:imidazoleglycerol-phosphate dehydratase
MRTAEVHRCTSETDVRVGLDLDGGGRFQVKTGLGFLDHMLEHVALHGLFNLQVACDGDLGVDAHHTVEDVALVVGQALCDALGDRAGIVRLGAAYVPMDEALAFVAVDLSGRPYSVIETTWSGSSVGTIPVTLIDHFFESVAVAARANVHARVLYGRDDHHMAEALFKALGRALAAAVALDPRRGAAVPSTKGSL